MAKSPNSVLRHASFGAGGMAWSDLNELAKYNKEVELVAVAEVDLVTAAEFRRKFPQVRVYQDYRDLLDVEAKRIDSVNVSTPDHMHAVMALSAMELGKHVYGQKPMAHDLFEVRRMTEFAREKNLVTQMGIQIHSHSHYRTATVLVKAGAIGKIKEVHSWCPKSWGDPAPKPDRVDLVPAGFDWNLWLGPCTERPFIGNNYYHPANWRKRLDFGTGTFGDMGCHIFDPVFTSLDLGAPVSIRSEGPAPNNYNWALDSKIHYVFPGTAYTAETSLKVTWYDGAQKPPAEIKALLEGDDYPDSGSILVGTQGVMVIPHIAKYDLWRTSGHYDYYKKNMYTLQVEEEEYVLKQFCGLTDVALRPGGSGGPSSTGSWSLSHNLIDDKKILGIAFLSDDGQLLLDPLFHHFRQLAIAPERTLIGFLP
jgi:predicted dehydrogenase